MGCCVAFQIYYNNGMDTMTIDKATLLQHFSKNASALAASKKLSARAIARITGDSHTLVNGALKGIHAPSIDAAARIADALGVGLDRLIYGSEEKSSK